MKKEIIYRLKKLQRITFTDIYLYDSLRNTIESFYETSRHFVNKDPHLVDALSKNALSAKSYLYSESEHIFFASFAINENKFIFIGPVADESLSFAQKHDFQKRHHLPFKEDLYVPVTDIQIFMDLVSLVYHIVISKEPDPALLRTNLNGNHSIEYERIHEKKQADDDEIYHHTYKEERMFSEAIKDGDLEKTLFYSEFLLPITGKLSNSSLNNLRNVAITGITIATRAAIEGGVNVSEAYRTSDIFINRFDRCTNLLELREQICQSNTEFVKLVQSAMHNRKYSTYVEQCKYYIENNFRHDISLPILAQELGISTSYLSHIFSQQESMTIRQYLVNTRILRAKNLLIYSNNSLLEICSYVGFSSQSYFSHVFKQKTGMTPAEYRNKYKTNELFRS